MYLSIRRKDERKGFTILGKFGGGQPQPIDYSKEYFFIEDVSGEENEVLFSGSYYYKSEYNLIPPIDIYYSFDKEIWHFLGTKKNFDLSLKIKAKQRVYIKSENEGFCFGYSQHYYSHTILCNKKYIIGGNIMSLCYGDDFVDRTILNFRNANFNSLFTKEDYSANTKLINADKLFLPIVTTPSFCFGRMFYKCTSLTTTPALPATTLATECYYYMFNGCTSLVEAPELPATTLVTECYRGMFNGCTALTKAPELPATTLANACYYYMFNGCTSLTTAPELPATTLINQCYQYMFQGCTSLVEAPALPATTLVSSCYFCMFNGCTKLNKVISYANDLPNYSITSWLSNVSKTGDFYNLGGATYESGSSGIPEGWTIHTTLE